ncbi:saccharopine dehydrogenase [Gonapodya prolifera JEL478]|uniref:Saccharopine dehydrogenase [NAD(+), L-lysine-forming] n=1 Tax=Gonapodya prolifera (strain JEL478) TaxID=1344416 RepID=A0A139AK61_GONPJ|nr:saccharopine dehydrogenase [Gonapodya prolifera JEL478]|eukprot:KXS16893.1 saccharopine dehydrogenase [Gonapodya prolifera JEL478]
MVHIWVRAETKPHEHRAALTPKTAKQLIDAGFKVTVERSSQSIFTIDEYERVGVEVVEEGSWRTAPLDAYIYGLKELPENDDSPLPHTHIMFAHCYKRQAGWRDVLARFDKGKGTLLDLEFLQDDKGRRVAAFGYHAGFAGAALGLDVWSHQQLEGNATYGAVSHFPTDTELIAHVRGRLEAAKAKTGQEPSLMVMGALGRCGRGAVDFARSAGVPDERIVKWDMAETANGGPFPEILQQDLFVNSIYLSKPIPPFVTKEMLNGDRALRVVVDVSCDTTNPHNPIPIYDRTTSFDDPTLSDDDPSFVLSNATPLQVVAIDHLPTLLPRESSEQFAADLLPTLLELRTRDTARVWNDAERLFREKVQEMRTGSA